MVQPESARGALATCVAGGKVVALLADSDTTRTVAVKVTAAVQSAIGSGPTEITVTDVRSYALSVHAVNSVADWFTPSAVADPAFVAVAFEPEVVIRASGVRVARVRSLNTLRTELSGPTRFARACARRRTLSMHTGLMANGITVSNTITSIPAFTVTFGKAWRQR